MNSPSLRVVYDYSHYQNGGEALGPTLAALLPYTVMICLQDGRNFPDRPGMDPLLPGDGTIDYRDYFRRLLAANYDGHMTCWYGEKYFDAPAEAAKRCYDKLSPIMQDVGIVRPTRTNRSPG